MRIEDINVTRHAVERFNERIRKAGRTEIQKLAFKALNEGIVATLDETIRPMILTRCERYNSVAYMFEGAVYIFIDETLTTIYPISWLAEYKSAA